MGYLIADAKRAQEEHAGNSKPASIRRHSSMKTYHQSIKGVVLDHKNGTRDTRYILKSHPDKKSHITSKRVEISISNKDLQNSGTSSDEEQEPKNHVLQMLHLEFELNKKKAEKKDLKKEIDVMDIDPSEKKKYIDKLDKESKLTKKTKAGNVEESFVEMQNDEKINKNGDKHGRRKIFWGGVHSKYHSNEKKKHSHDECSVNTTCSQGKCCVERRHSEWVCVDKGTKSVDQKCLDTCMCRGGFTCFSFVNPHKEISSSNTNKNSGQCISKTQMKNHNGYVLDQSKNMKIRSKLLNLTKYS